MPASYIIDIMEKINCDDRYNLTIVAFHIARTYKVSPAKALELLNSNQVNFKDVEELFIKSLQKIQPEEAKNTIKDMPFDPWKFR
jgi:hypothetical protein